MMALHLCADVILWKVRQSVFIGRGQGLHKKKNPNRQQMMGAPAQWKKGEDVEGMKG